MAALPSPSPIQLLPLTSFIGGLNLRADAFQLAPEESPDLLNVDLDPRGGFRLRDGVAPLNGTPLDDPPLAIWQFATVSGSVRQVMVQTNHDSSDQIAYSTGSNFTTFTPDSESCSGFMRSSSFKDCCYIQRNAEAGAVKWDGSSSSVLGTSFNDNIEAPTGGNMPMAKCIAAHSGYMFIANTVESDVSYGSRIRWSHPNMPEDFRSQDFIDIDIGHDGDEITALVPFTDHLLIFKHNSVHALFGFGNTSFGTQPVTQAVGAISQEAVAATEFGVYFFSASDGLMFVSTRGAITWLFERIVPALQDGRIPRDDLPNVRVGWINRRVWVSVPWNDSTSRVLVLDPSLGVHRRGGLHLGEEGAWTMYDIPCSGFLQWAPPGAEVKFLALYPNDGRVLLLHQEGSGQDDFGGDDPVDIASYYVTRWQDVNSPAVFKRWKRPEVVLRNSATYTLRVDVYHNYDDAQIKRTSFISTNVPSEGDFVWDESNWDEALWGGDSPNTETIVKLPTLGKSRAVRLKITGPSGPSVPWQVDAVTLKYIPTRVRN